MTPSEERERELQNELDKILNFAWETLSRMQTKISALQKKTDALNQFAKDFDKLKQQLQQIEFNTRKERQLIENRLEAHDFEKAKKLLDMGKSFEETVRRWDRYRELILPPHDRMENHDDETSHTDSVE